MTHPYNVTGFSGERGGIGGLLTGWLPMYTQKLFCEKAKNVSITA